VKRLIASVLLSLPVILCSPLLGQVSGACSKPFEAAMSPGRQLAVDIRSGDVTIVGSAQPFLRVTCQLRDGDSPDGVKVSLAANHLRVYGGPYRDIRLRIEVPDKTNLLIRASAGNMTISGVAGDKDVELRAGNLTIHVGAPESYRVAEGSVLAGDLNASVFGVVKDGLFRNFRKENSAGQYRLRAKLLAGDLTLK
jgi:hypothetical protein